MSAQVPPVDPLEPVELVELVALVELVLLELESDELLELLELLVEFDVPDEVEVFVPDEPVPAVVVPEVEFEFSSGSVGFAAPQPLRNAVAATTKIQSRTEVRKIIRHPCADPGPLDVVALPRACESEGPQHLKYLRQQAEEFAVSSGRAVTFLQKGMLGWSMFIGHFDLTHPLLWSIPELLSAQECASIIAGSEKSDWLAATVNSAEGRVVRKEVRNNTLAILPDAALAQTLFTRSRPKIPVVLMGRQLYGLREPLRIYRYEQGQRFGLHGDQSYDGPDNTSSLLTFMVYLNEDFEGGDTDFPEQGERIKPRTGAGLVFQHMVLHEGCEVTRGIKFVIRSDVLYRPRR